MNSPFMMMALVADGTLHCGWGGGGDVWNGMYV